MQSGCFGTGRFIDPEGHLSPLLGWLITTLCRLSHITANKLLLRPDAGNESWYKI